MTNHGSVSFEYNDWELFSNVARSEYRYFFNDHFKRRDGASHLVGLVDWLCSTLCENAVTEIKSGTIFYRARRNPANLSASEFGPPPHALARASRMSPAGIPMFYLAYEEETALAECTGDDGRLGLARSRTGKQLVAIDLRKFGTLHGTDRQVEFAGKFVRDLVKKVGTNHGSLAEVEYVPTQIITEYLRFCQDESSRMIEALVYRSSVCDGTAIVVFYDAAQALGGEANRGNFEFVDARWTP